MIVYVETNFLIALGLEQEQYESAQHILDLAKSNQIELAIPALAILESLHTVEGRSKRRMRAYVEIKGESRQLRRSKSASSTVTMLETVLGRLTALEGEQLNTLQDLIAQVLSCARVLDLNRLIFRDAVRHQQLLKLKPMDSIIYASILADLQNRDSSEACFLTSDGSFHMAVLEPLREAGCRCFRNFYEAVRHIETAAT